jgi:hypothetical protein
VTELDESGGWLKNPLAIMWMERFVVMQRTSNEMARGKFQGVSQLDGEGMLMPAFSFEKISPPAPGAEATPTPKETNEKPDRKPPGVIVQMLDRIAQARARRGRKEATASARPKPGTKA